MRTLGHIGVGILIWPLAIVVLALIMLFFPVIWAVDAKGESHEE